LIPAGVDVISPQSIEFTLTGKAEIARAMLCGDGWVYL